ncbi:RNA-binding domain-containing protein [Epithele typhae]|uniref:RNA-binding domain-containing protein n=1 Tax=Epithele typhae TaxID=378194 RepID=UPI002007D18A|nr:RNA-binding domain-containing protein [Epithele typhae]KAH9932113.1 RNA-binding domain-containing protein [Epithele typhae]
MDDAWQSQDMAPPSNGGISIPTNDAPMSNAGPADDQNWNGNSRSPQRDGPRRSSRSRSPGRPAEREPQHQNPGNNLHVSGLSHKVDTRDLEQAFAKVGRVKKAQVMYDPHSRESRGFGFVTMESGEEADAAITAMNGTEIMGKSISVEKARRGRARTPTPGRYYGPPKRNDFERPYDPRPFDGRYRDTDDRRERPPYRGEPREYRRDYDRGGYGGRPEYREERGPRHDHDRRYDDRRDPDRRY